VSADGFVCRGPDDDMSWTCRQDKTLFRMVTTQARVLGAGSVTYDIMHSSTVRLDNRLLVRLTRIDDSSAGLALSEFARRYPNGCVVGGQRLMRLAIESGLVTSLMLCHNERVFLGAGQAEALRMKERGAFGWWRSVHDFGPDLTVHMWRKY
jgi:dihydrofolate reductase